MSSFRPRKIILFFIFLFSICIGILFYTKDNFIYDHLSREIFQNELCDNTLTLHYTLRNPEKYGIRQDKVLLPAYTKEKRQAASDACSDYLQQLERIDPSRLTHSRKTSYLLAKRYFTLQDKLNQFPYYSEPCTPGSGMQTTLPILFSEYRFYDKDDIENYLSLLSQLDEYFEGLSDFESEKEAAGLFMSDESAQKVIAECLSYIELSKDPDSHFLVTSFEERLQKFHEAYPQKLSDEAISDFLIRNRTIIQEQLPKGYQKLADTFASLKGKKCTSNGLGSTKDGKAFYTLLLRKNTGSYLSMDAIEQLLFKQFDSLCHDIRQTDPRKSVVATPQISAEEILSVLKKEMSDSYPVLPQNGSGKAAPLCDIKYIDDALADYCAPAFFLVPPIDDYDTNIIYINPQNSASALSLFTTLAHEGFPGHLYQTVYAHQSQLYTPGNPLRSILSYEGYCEGWALYVELESYQYAEKYYSVSGKLQQLSRNLDLCLCALLDFQIHYRDMEREHVYAFLNSLGVSAEAAKSLYEYIVNEPTTYLKYYLSYLEINSLKETARQKWGSSYSDYRFHKFYLDAGPSDFITLRENL